MSKDVIVNETAHTGVSQLQLNTADGGTALFQDVDEVSAAGEEVFYSSYGAGYTKNTVLPANVTTLPEYIYNCASEMETFSAPELALATGPKYTFVSCEKLVSIHMPKLTNVNANFARYCEALKSVEVGAIGYPVTGVSPYTFLFSSGGAITFTIYVDAETLADIPTGISESAPFGMENGTVVYRNATTGEVITE